MRPGLSNGLYAVHKPYRTVSRPEGLNAKSTLNCVCADSDCGHLQRIGSLKSGYEIY